MKKILALGALGAVIVVTVLLPSAVGAGIRDHGKDWDYLLFTQSWPVTVCLEWKSKGKGHTCSLPKQDVWTIHGVWPTKTNTKGPLFCNSSMPFDKEALSPLVSELENYWTNVDFGTAPYSFWKHEWEKHGTCAAQLPAMKKEVLYFEQGLSWQKKFDIHTALEKAKISEGNNYTPQQIKDAVKDSFGKSASLHCYSDGNTRKTYLNEIRLCIDKQLQLIDCPKTNSNCPSCAIEYPNLQEVSKQYEVKGKWLIDFLRIVRWVQWITY